jgi:predicted small lipoprotein YifL
VSRFTRLVAAVLVSGALAACGSDGPTETPAPPAAATSAPVASPSAVGASSPGGGGFASVDQAVARHLADASGARYVGPCERAKPDPDAVCAIKMATVDGGEVYGVGAPASEIVGFLLLRRGADGWRVVDDYAPDGVDASAPAWMAGLG